MAVLPLVLAGPIVRRVESASVSIWLALSKRSTVALQVYEGPVDAAAVPSPSTPIFASGEASSIALGENLHVVVVTATPPDGVLGGNPVKVEFLPGAFYSYDVFIQPEGGATEELGSLGLLKSSTLNGYEQPPLGYFTNQLPGFRPPPAAVSELRIVQGGCRKPHDAGPDALVQLADFLDVTKARTDEAYPVDVIPQMLFLTGDQIYADDVSLALLPLLTVIGNDLLGGEPEPMQVLALPATDSTQLAPVPATLVAFPNGVRRPLVTGKDANLTSDDCECHLLSFAEFCAMYLMTSSNVLWPAEAAFSAPTAANVPAMAPDQAPAVQKFLAALSTDERNAQSREKRERYCKQLTELKLFARGLGQVRQALANIATYTMLDDHEVTDDWYLSLEWKTKVLRSALGRQIVRNGLVAFAFFQGWGNDPKAFATGGKNGTLLAAAALAMTGRKAADLDALDSKLGLTEAFVPSVSWNYQLLDPHWSFGVLVLDERTRRGYRTDVSPPARIAPVEMTLQIPNPLASTGREVLFVIAPAPVLGLSVIEELLQPGSVLWSNFRHAENPAGEAESDLEPWSQDPSAFELLLQLLAPAERIVFLSGDVHFAHGAAMTYWPRAAPPARFVQFTSSALKNSGESEQLQLLRSYGFAQRIFRSGAPAARLAWAHREPPPLSFPPDAQLGSFPPEVRSRFLKEPVLLPAQRWPSGVSFARDPDWVWALNLLFDARPEADREDRPLLPPNVPDSGPVANDKLAEVARYHIESMKKRGISRQTVFAHNIGVVSISSPAGVLTATHTIYSPPLAAPDTFEPLTIHQAALVADPAEPKPGLQP